MRDLRKAPVATFLDALASAAPAPGGGSAAALVAALGLGLLEMTARINDRRARRKGARPGPASRIAAVKKLRLRAERLVTIDARTFLGLSPSFRKPRDSRVFQEALRRSARPPFEIASIALAGLGAARRERPRTSRWIASDLAESAMLLLAAFRAARLNVEVNLRDLSDRARARGRARALDRDERRARAIEREVSGIFRP